MHPYFLSFALIIVTVGLYVIAVKPRLSGWAATAFLFIAIFGLYLTMEGMGLAKPLRAEMFGYHHSEQEIIAYYPVPGDSLYVWVKGEASPISYRLDWDPEKAKKLEEYKRKGKRSYLSHGRGIDSEIHEMPQPAMPPKHQ